jgi:hypothetical protein
MNSVQCNEDQVCTGTELSDIPEDGDEGGAGDGDRDVSGRLARRKMPRKAGMGRWKVLVEGEDEEGEQKGQENAGIGRVKGVGEEDEEEGEVDDERGGAGHNRGWMRAVVDMYMASLADGDVQLPGEALRPQRCLIS